MKKLLSLILALALLICCVPTAAATEDNSVTVYLTVSKNTDFMVMNGTTMALYKITVPYFDLALYGLEDFYYNPDCYAGGTKESQFAGTAQTAYGKVTMLHLFIYATEVIYHGKAPSEAGKGWLARGGNWQGFSVSGDRAGSSYCKFWSYGNNATYFLNYEFPLGRANWGASCDQILLKDYDIVSARYNAHTGKDGAFFHIGEPEDFWMIAEQGEEVPMLLFTTTSTDMDNGGETIHEPVTNPTSVYVTRDSAPTSHAAATPAGQTDADGLFILDTTNLEPGIYYITTNTWDPAVAILEVLEGETPAEPEAPAVAYGDLTGDGVINVFDAAQAYQIVNGKRTATDAQKQTADVNGDGNINVFDAALIYSYVNGKRSDFPAESK